MTLLNYPSSELTRPELKDNFKFIERLILMLALVIVPFPSNETRIQRP